MDSSILWCTGWWDQRLLKVAVAALCPAVAVSNYRMLMLPGGSRNGKCSLSESTIMVRIETPERPISWTRDARLETEELKPWLGL